MKFGIVSDIHCNAPGLTEGLRRMGDIDALICLGDSIWEYRFSNDVVAILKERGAHTILGNHEECFFGPLGERARARPGSDPELMDWLGTRPHRIRLDADGKSLLLVHSTPWEPRGAYIHPENSELARFAEADADFVLYGHTHAQVVRRFDRVTVINPGSAGDGRDSRNGRLLSCAVLDTATGDVHLIDYPDPGEGEVSSRFQYFEDYEPGAVVTGGSFPVTEAEILEFARRYDPQAMHIDKPAATRGEFGGLIASGWHTAAMMMNMVAEVLLSPVADLASPGIDELRWLLPVRPGDVLSLRATIIEARRSRSKPDQGVVKSLVEVLNQKAEVVMSLKPVSLVRCRSNPSPELTPYPVALDGSPSGGQGSALNGSSAS